MKELKFRACHEVYGKVHWVYSEEKGLPLFFGIVETKNLEVEQYTGHKDENGNEIYEPVRMPNDYRKERV